MSQAFADGTLNNAAINSFSFEWKQEGNVSATIVAEVVRDTGQNAAVSAQSLSTYSTYQGNGWYKFERSISLNNAGSDTTYFRLRVGDATPEIVDMRIRKVQWEVNDFVTPFTATERTTTNALDTLTGDYTITLSNLSYASNNTFSFDNTANSKIIIDHDPSLLIASNLTMEGWIRTSGPQNNLYPRIWDKGRYLMHVRDTSDFNIALNLTTTNGLRQITTAFQELSANTWYHVVGTYANGQVSTIYVNGEQEARTDFGNVHAITTSSDNLYIGGSGGTDRAFDGNIESFRIYDKALTQAEVLQNYNATKSRYL